jgi:thiol-disulfide isomerase/thioredoxin
MFDQGHQSVGVRGVDRLRHLTFALALFTFACDEPAKPEGQAPSRFQSVQNDVSSQKAAEAFCEKTFAAKTKPWSEPPSRPMPKPAKTDETAAAHKGAGWTWVNLWASWCGPCIKELPLLSRWRDTLAKEGTYVRFELWSVDAAEDELVGALDRPFPGEVRWLRSEDDLPALLESLGVDKGSAIPVHALVDRSNNLRCVRVGSIGEESYGQVKSILAAP